MAPCALEIADLDVELGQCDVQFGGRTSHELASSLGQPQCLVTQVAGRAGPTDRAPQVGEHHDAAQLVDDVPRRVQARHGLPERHQRLRHLAVRPGREAEEPGSPAPDEMIVRSREVQGPLGLSGGPGDVALCLGQ